MPVRPPPKWMEWQLKILPQVVTNFRRPFYLNPRNNQPGGDQGPPRARPPPKPAPIVHVPKQTKDQALANASIGTAVGGPTTSSYLKVADLPAKALSPGGLSANGPSLGSAPTAGLRAYLKDKP